MSADPKPTGKVDLLELGIYTYLRMKGNSVGEAAISATALAPLWRGHSYTAEFKAWGDMIREVH